MSDLETWAQGKNPTVAFMAIFFANHSEAFCTIACNAKDPSMLQHLGQLAKLPLPLWLSYYLKRKLYLHHFTEIFTDFNNIDKQLLDETVAQNVLDATISAPPTQSALAEELYKNLGGSENIIERFATPSEDLLRAFVFWLQVALPCYLLYLKHPGQLLREARLGNLDSMEKLLRLDSSTLFDRRIANRLHNLRYTKPSTFARLIDCVNKPPKRKVTPQKFKVFLASGISAMAHHQKAPLTEAELRKLFDIIAKQNGKGEIDTDLPESPDAFSKGIRRDFPFWKTVIQPDRK